MVSKNKLQSLSLVTALCNGKDGVFVVDKYCISRVQIKTAPSIEGAVSKLAVAAAPLANAARATAFTRARPTPKP